MSYIGREPQVGNFQVCDAISVVNGQAAYTMQVSSVNVSPETANHMIVSLNGVIQKPNSSFTVSGSTITFASNLVTGDVINFIQILGSVLDLGVPSDSTVSLAKLTATGTKNSTTFLRGDNTFDTPSGGGITVADQWRMSADLAANGSNVTITANLEQVDDTGAGFIGSAMSVSSGIWTFPSTGIYQVSTVYDFSASGSAMTDVDVKIHTTTDNSTYDQTTANYSSAAAGSKTTGYTQHIFDVTNTSNCKVKFVYYTNTASTLRGSSTQTETGFNFLRLGDT